MRNRYTLLLSYAIIFNFLSCNATFYPTEQQPETSLIASLAVESNNQALILTPTSRTILHLFYITQHLDPALVFIKKTIAQSKKTDQQCALHVISFFSEKSILKSEKIKNVFSHICETHSLTPLFLMWKNIKQFRYGIHPEEKNILLDFSKICLITYQSLLTTLNNKLPTTIPYISPEDLDSLEQIEEVFETMEKCSLFYFLRKLPSFRLSTPPPFQNPRINEFCASFALRYYLNKRLKTAFSSFASFHKKHAALFTQGVEYLGFKKEDLIFNDQVIAGYFDLLQQEKQLDPLMQLIGQFQSFDFIKSPVFIKEFLILLCIAYKDLILENKSTNRSTETVEKLHELSLEELLHVIDTINEKYGKKPSAKKGSSKIPLRHPPSPRLQRDLRGYGGLRSPKGILERTPQKSCSISTLIEDQYKVSPDAFTNLVFHRYYYIKRLEDVVKTLLKLTEQDTPNNHRSSVKKTTLLLKPFAMAWEDFIAYKDICDQQLIDDFTKEIFFLSQKISHTSLAHHYGQILQTFLSKQKSSADQLDLMSDFKPSIETNNVISRFYLIKRLEPILTRLNFLYENNLLHLGCTSTTTGSDPCLQHLIITKAPIKEMIHKIYSIHSFKPVFTMWNGISHYKYIQDAEICSEFARFITHLLHSTATHLRGTCYKEIFIEGKKFLPLDQLHDMPLEDILNLLDLLVEELPLFLKENEIGSNINWKEWLKKYWLIAPLKAAIFGISIYLMYKGTLAKPEHHHPVPADVPVPNPVNTA